MGAARNSSTNVPHMVADARAGGDDPARRRNGLEIDDLLVLLGRLLDQRRFFLPIQSLTLVLMCLRTSSLVPVPL